MVASDDGYNIFQIVKQFNEGIPEFSEIAEQVRLDYIQKRAEKVARDEAEKIRNHIVASGGFDKAEIGYDELAPLDRQTDSTEVWGEESYFVFFQIDFYSLPLTRIYFFKCPPNGKDGIRGVFW